VNNDIRGLIDSVNDNSTSAFMWEWFTTKPFVDAGEVRFVSVQILRLYVRIRINVQIGSVPTPWPSWLIAAHPERTSPEAVTAFLTRLSTFVRAFDSEESRVQKNVDFIKENFGYPAEDIEVGAAV
jgi:hypothetical protein